MKGRIPLLQQVLPSEPREPSNGGRHFVGSSTVATLPISESRLSDKIGFSVSAFLAFVLRKSANCFQILCGR